MGSSFEFVFSIGELDDKGSKEEKNLAGVILSENE